MISYFYPRKVMRRGDYRRDGFTLLEIVLVVAVLALMGTLAMTSFVRSRNLRDLTVSAQNVMSTLRLAQSKAVGGEDRSVWGVHLESSQAVLFRGTNYSTSTSTQAHALPPHIELVNIALAGGGSDAMFNRLDGKTNQSGTFAVRVRTDPSAVFSVTIDSSGKVYQTSTAPVSGGTRVVDTRHRAFALGWSIRDAVTLTLTFSDPPNPDTVSSIAMDPPAPRTTFNWSGSVLVGGVSEALRIHATSITDSNSTLHIDRDCRTNSKKLLVSIDGKTIATYEADCQTLTVGPFGGTVSEP